MTEPSTGIFVTLFVLLATVMLLLTAYARFRRKPRMALIFFAILTLASLDMALITLLMSTAPLLGIPFDIRWRVAFVAFLVGGVAVFVGSLLFYPNPPLLTAYTHMPTWLYHWLYGESEHQSSSSGR